MNIATYFEKKMNLERKKALHSALWPYLLYLCPTMGKWQDFFGMTRHERRGTIALLTLIALVLAVTALLRLCSPAPQVELQHDDVELFEQQIDSIQPSAPAHKKHKNPATTRKPQRPSKHPKSPPQPRRLDPVPQI